MKMTLQSPQHTCAKRFYPERVWLPLRRNAIGESPQLPLDLMVMAVNHVIEHLLSRFALREGKPERYVDDSTTEESSHTDARHHSSEGAHQGMARTLAVPGNLVLLSLPKTTLIMDVITTTDHESD